MATGGGSCRDFDEQVVQCQGEAKGFLQGGREKYVIYNTLTNGKNENTCNKIITSENFHQSYLQMLIKFDCALIHSLLVH